MLQKSSSRSQTISLSPRPAAHEGLNGNVLLFFILVVLTSSFFLANAGQPAEELTARFTLDDSFYYFETAWQTLQNGFVTFDGINPASGVHFLWFVILLAVAAIAPYKLFILYAAYWISFALVLAVYAAIWRIGGQLEDRSRLLTLLMAFCWIFLLSDQGNLFFVGMESTLHMTALGCCLIAWLRLMRALDERESFPGPELLVFTVSLVLVTWVRIDSGLAALLLYAYAQAAVARRKGRNAPFGRYLAISAAIAVAGAAIQVGFFYTAGGTLLPISGLVKATGVGPEIKADLWTRYMSILYPIATFHGEPTPLRLASELALFGMLLGYAVLRALRAPAPMRHVHGFAAVLGVAAIIYTPIVGAYHDPFWRWYLAPIFLFYILTISCALHEAWEALFGRSPRIPVLPGVVGLTAALFCMVLFFASYRPVPHFLARAQLGQLLKQTTKKDDILAAFNAGQIAFFSDRRTINLDGLVNDYAYLRNVLDKPENLLSYLREKNVRHLVDYDFYWANDVIRTGTTLRAAFPIQDDRLQRVLYVRDVPALR